MLSLIIVLMLTTKFIFHIIMLNNKNFFVL